jgi:uncharacterized protein
MIQSLGLSVWNTTCLLAPWLLAGAAIAGVLHAVLPPGWLGRRFSGPAGVFKAVLLGVPLPLCSCGVIPAGISLRKQGASDQAAIAFLISTPQTGVDSILVSASFLGWPFAFFKVAVAAVTGIIGGLLSVDTRSEAEICANAPLAIRSTPPRRSRISPAIEHAVDVIQSVWGWLVIGIVLSAVIELWIVPSDGFQAIRDKGPLVSMILVLVVSLPMYVCATASVPMAAALVAGGLSPGAAIVFLVAGPATNIATIGSIMKQFGLRNLIVYLTTLIVGSLAGGMLFENLVAGAGARNVGHNHDHHEIPSWTSIVAAILLVSLMGWFAIQDIRRWARRRGLAGRPGLAESKTFSVTGMNCQGCVAKIEKELAKIDQIGSVKVDLDGGKVVVTGTADADTVRSGIRAAGFEVPA